MSRRIQNELLEQAGMPTQSWFKPRDAWPAEYAAYHAEVVLACLELMGEDLAGTFDKEYTFFEEFEEAVDPDEVAMREWENL